MSCRYDIIATAVTFSHNNNLNIIKVFSNYILLELHLSSFEPLIPRNLNFAKLLRSKSQRISLDLAQQRLRLFENFLFVCFCSYKTSCFELVISFCSFHVKSTFYKDWFFNSPTPFLIRFNPNTSKSNPTGTTSGCMHVSSPFDDATDDVAAVAILASRCDLIYSISF